MAKNNFVLLNYIYTFVQGFYKGKMYVRAY